MKKVPDLQTASLRRNGEIEKQNTLLAAIIESAADAIISVDLDGFITSWNPTAEQIYGYSAQEIIGQNVLLLVLPENKQQMNELLVKVRDGHRTGHFETVRIRKDGSTFPISITISPIRAYGAVIGTSSIVRDITEQKQAFQNASRLAAIVASSDDAIVSYTLDGIYTSWNPAAERLFGYSADEMIGQPLLTLVPSESVNAVANILGKIRKGQPISNYETVRLRKDGSAVPVSMTVSNIYDLTGAAIGGSSICRDLTEQKHASQNAARMASIIEFSNDAIISGSLEGIVNSCNPAAEKMYGYLAEEMIGQSVDVLYHPDSPFQMADIMDKIKIGSLVSNIEVLRMRKDGSAIPASLTVSPIYDLTGILVGTSSITRDLTELKKAEQKFRVILESSPNAMVIVNRTGIITIINSKTEQVFGYRRDEMLGQPVELLMPNRFHADLPSRLDRYFADTQGQFMGPSLELIGRRKDGQEFPIETNMSQIETADGVLIVATVRDVTEHRQMIRRLEEMNELRNEFVAIVAHDLRAPMMSISGFAHLLIDMWDTTSDDEKIEYLKIIARSTENMAEFVEDALQVARIEAGEYIYDIDAFDIRSLVQRALDEADGANVDRRFELIASGDIPLVLGDADRQWQILTNLLSNAVKFSPAEEPITVGLSCIGDSVQVAITDRGIGIANDDISKLFQKFGRLSTPGVKKIPGTGLGLYICKTLVETQGGQIWCESSPGQGSTFFFTIPVAR